MSQMNYADRQLETALTAMFERKVTENRSTMRYWPAVSDRLGEQVSRRPWEYVMDAINRPRMPFKPQYIYAAGSALVVVIAVLLLVLLLNTDDGASGENVPADSPESTVPDATITQRLAVIPATEPVAGSQEEAVFDLFDRAVSAINVEDWDAFVEICNPNRKHFTPTQAELIIGQGFSGSHDDLSTLNFRDVTVQLYDDGTAITESYVYRDDELVYSNPNQTTWHSEDGVWYGSNYCSAIGR